jgi:hypothetical protein
MTFKELEELNNQMKMISDLKVADNAVNVSDFTQLLRALKNENINWDLILPVDTQQKIIKILKESIRAERNKCEEDFKNMEIFIKE